VTGRKFENLTLILLTWSIWSASNNASRCQMGFNSAFDEAQTALFKDPVRTSL